MPDFEAKESVRARTNLSSSTVHSFFDQKCNTKGVQLSKMTRNFPAYAYYFHHPFRYLLIVVRAITERDVLASASAGVVDLERIAAVGRNGRS